MPTDFRLDILDCRPLYLVVVFLLIVARHTELIPEIIVRECTAVGQQIACGCRGGPFERGYRDQRKTSTLQAHTQDAEILQFAPYVHEKGITQDSSIRNKSICLFANTDAGFARAFEKDGEQQGNTGNGRSHKTSCFWIHIILKQDFHFV
ncbi:hypothetical protein DF052_23505 [Burkholderia glumae]|nr:hypothetical protein DF052_23505 [Burkholderia glumae]